MKKNSKLRKYVLVLFIFLIAVTVRFLFPRADATKLSDVGIAWVDEGAWAHNARNKVLFGKWNTDDWDPIFVSPIHTIIQYAAFKLFGVGTLQARLGTMLMGSLICIIVYFAMKMYFRYSTAVLAMLFVAFNYFFIMQNRIAIHQTTYIFFIVCAFLFFQIGNRIPKAHFITGIVSVVSVFAKIEAFFIIPALVTVYLITIFQAKDYNSLRSNLKVFLYYVFGVITSLSFFMLFWVLPFSLPIVKWNLWYASARINELPFSMLLNFFYFPIKQNFFLKMPLLTLLTFLSVILITQRKSMERGKYLTILFLLSWLFWGIFEISISNICEVRRNTFLIPVMACLAAYLFEQEKSNGGLSKRFKGKYIYIVFTLILYFPVSMLFRLFLLDTAVRVILTLGCSVLISFYMLTKRQRMELIGTFFQKKYVKGTLVVLFLLINSYQYGLWIVNRDYKIYNASKKLGEVIPPSTIQGNIANALCFENKHLPVFIASGYANDFAKFTRDKDIEYFLTFSKPYLGAENGAMKKLVDYHYDAIEIARFELYDYYGDSLGEETILFKKKKKN